MLLRRGCLDNSVIQLGLAECAIPSPSAGGIIKQPLVSAPQGLSSVYARVKWDTYNSVWNHYMSKL